MLSIRYTFVTHIFYYILEIIASDFVIFLLFYNLCELIPYPPVIGSLKIPIFSVLNVNIIKPIKMLHKMIIAKILLHLNLLIISKYAVSSPNIVAIKNDAMFIISMFFPKIPVYV